MRINQNVLKARKKNIIILMVFIALEIIFVLLAAVFNGQNNGGSPIKMILPVFAGLTVILCVALDIFFWHRYIHGLGRLVHVEPVPCTVENFIITYIKQNHRLKYIVTPVLRSNIDGRLYITLGRLSTSWYRSLYASTGHSLSNIKIIRSDGTDVNIGDTAYMYISQTVTPNIVIDRISNTVNIGKDIIRFSANNNSLPIDIFNSLTYFRGAADVDPI